jgi:glycosyltransferase involved in cell wall biosynthesis
MAELQRDPPEHFDVRPVYAGRWHGYRYADAYPQRSGTRLVAASPGDVFLALDLTAHILPRHRLQLGGWKANGARICFVVHDLLPIMHPEWFTARAHRNYGRWIRCLMTLGDGALCTSLTGAARLRDWLERQAPGLEPPLSIGSFLLAGDLEASSPSSGLPAGFGERLSALRGSVNVLAVGTIEPRKAYGQVLSAFERLWAAGEEINLLIVGRLGWKSGQMAARLRGHAQAGRRLHWFEDVSDEALGKLYDRADGLLMASYDEGFGLPLVEAARHGRPILARDIPVFREIAGAHAEYFSGQSADALASAVSQWAARLKAGNATASGAIARLTWRESTRQLLRALAAA